MPQPARRRPEVRDQLFLSFVPLFRPQRLTQSIGPSLTEPGQLVLEEEAFDHMLLTEEELTAEAEAALEALSRFTGEEESGARRSRPLPIAPLRLCCEVLLTCFREPSLCRQAAALT